MSKSTKKEGINLSERLTGWLPSNKYEAMKMYCKLMVKYVLHKSAKIMVFFNGIYIILNTVTDDCVNNDIYYNQNYYKQANNINARMCI